MKVYISKENSNLFRKFLIPKDDKDQQRDYIEITIDYSESIFVAKKQVHTVVDLNIWKLYEENTFPSSLLNEFLRTEQKNKV